MLYQRDALNYTTHQAVHIKTNKYERNKISTEEIKNNKFNRTYIVSLYKKRTPSARIHTHTFITKRTYRKYFGSAFTLIHFNNRATLFSIAALAARVQIERRKKKETITNNVATYWCLL